jgi:TonB-linked SusC/RagA family outer membrane protein
MRKFLSMLFLTWLTCNCYAQTTVIKGRVTDEKGQPLPGVTITLKNTQQHTVSNTDGNFILNAVTTISKTLTFRFIGYGTRDIDLEGKTTIDVKMDPESKGLDEVVITALNIPREKKSLGVSQQSVNVDDMTQARAANITDLLDGKVSGLQITTSGQSTGSTRVVIRGMGSITGDNQPLWVVDGVPIDNSDGQNGNSNMNGIDYGNGASALNPDDIQNIEVLKGPNAAALYGSRAANGAILVTTKKGKKNAGLGVSFNENYMAGRILQFPDFQNIYGEGINSSLSGTPNAQNLVQEGGSTKSWGGPMLGQPYADFSGAPISYVPHPDNITSLYQTAYTLNQNVAISNAFETPGVNGAPPLASSIRFSYTRTDANDVMQKQNLQKKNNFSMNVSKDFTSYLRIDTRLQYLQTDVQNRVGRNEDPSNPMNTYLNLPRSVGINDLTPWKDDAGNEFTSGNIGLENPYWLINENYNHDNLNTIIGGLTATLKIIPGLQFRAQVSSNLNWGGRQVFLQKGAASNNNGKLGFYSESAQNNQNWNTEGLLMFNKQIKDFSILANLGGNIRKVNNSATSSQITSLLGHDVMNLANNASISTSNGNVQRSQVNSLYATASIGYKGYLYLDLTGRNDWSSTLPAANRSFFYPSVSTSFVFSEFFHIPQGVMSFGKFRAAVAVVGNDTNPYNLNSLFGYRTSFNGNPLVTFDNILRNNDLKPEKTTSTELGLELRFLHDRISFDGSVYKKNTTNQILTGAVSLASGFQNRVINAGSVSNKGIELSVNVTPVRGTNFQWDINTNFSVNRNRVNSLADGITQFRLGGALLTSVYAEVGQPIGVIRGEDWMKDANGHVLIIPTSGVPYSETTPYASTGNIQAYLGNFQPDALASFGSTFRYKDFDFKFLLSGRFGGQLFSGTYWRANQNGVTTETLANRDAYEFSNVILGEGGNATNFNQTSMYGYTYPDGSRIKGPIFQGYYPLTDSKGAIVFDKNGRMIADLTKPNTYYPGLQTYYQRYSHINSLMIFDASYIKLTQVIIGYTIPRQFIKRTIFKSARISLVGRNLWTILQHTPRGVDPESSNSSGNAQGLELGGALPYTYYGADFTFSF